MATRKDGRAAGSGSSTSAEDRRYLERFGDKLSPSTRRAKWISRTDDRPDRKGQTLATRSRDVIRSWADERGARPATATRGPDGKPRTLRMRFTDESGGRLEEISWDEWLSTFEERELTFLYQQQRRDGNTSNFFRLDNPRREDG